MNSILKNTRLPHLYLPLLSAPIILLTGLVSACGQDLREIPLNQLTDAQQEELERVLTVEEATRIMYRLDAEESEPGKADSLSTNQILAMTPPLDTGDEMPSSIPRDSALALRYSEMDMDTFIALAGAHITVYEFKQMSTAVFHYNQSEQEEKLNRMTYAELLEEGRKYGAEHSRELKP